MAASVPGLDEQDHALGEGGGGGARCSTEGNGTAEGKAPVASGIRYGWHICSLASGSQWNGPAMHERIACQCLCLCMLQSHIAHCHATLWIMRAGKRQLAQSSQAVQQVASLLLEANVLADPFTKDGGCA